MAVIKSIRMIGMTALAAGLGLLAAPAVLRAQDSVFVSSTGNVGIGTTNPAAKLHVDSGELRLPPGGDHGIPNAFTHFNYALNGWNYIRGTTVIADGNGYVGIGVTNPQAKFHVGQGEVRLPPGGDNSNPNALTHFNYVGNGRNYIRGTTVIADTGGSVGIGAHNPAAKLHVSGGHVLVTEGSFIVTGGSFIDDGTTLNAPDYVFEPSYKLMPLEELREFVSKEKHLPNVPNAREVKEKGLNLSQFQMRLLEKIEELTLYTLSQHQQIADLHEKNSELKDRLEALEGALQQQ